MQQFDALGIAGGAGSVDQGGQRVRAQGADGLVHAGGMFGQIGRAPVEQVVPDDHPVVGMGIGRPVVIDEDDVVQLGVQFGGLVHLGELRVVLEHHHHRARIADDVAHVLDIGIRVDRRGRGSGAGDGQVGLDPLQPGGTRYGDPLLVLQTQGEEPGSGTVDDPAHLTPCDVTPAVAIGHGESDLGRVCGDPVAEHRWVVRSTLRENRVGDLLCVGVHYAPRWLPARAAEGHLLASDPNAQQGMSPPRIATPMIHSSTAPLG